MRLTKKNALTFNKEFESCINHIIYIFLLIFRKVLSIKDVAYRVIANILRIYCYHDIGDLDVLWRSDAWGKQYASSNVSRLFIPVGHERWIFGSGYVGSDIARISRISKEVQGIRCSFSFIRFCIQYSQHSLHIYTLIYVSK